ncbi:MAG TPA: class I tRNA ligase family protein, partial [Iamia sp.]|nr:class I tRNA ligase family protein [Iamia sp.]
AQRDQPGGFTGDPDVFDTWATSSLTPLLACGWEDDPELYERTYPMDLRPQGHDIIRTWLFSTMVRSHFETDSPPWRNAALSGWILDPDRKKMSKSKGNVVVPLDLLQQHGSDAVRYWAANGRPGTDTAFDTGQMKVGRRLAIKVLNASRFALDLGPAPEGSAPTEALDRSVLVALADLVDEATRAFDDYDYARALQRTEAFFWSFCDDYLELVKTRAYGEDPDDAAAASARTTLALALSTLLRLFAPILPFATEEVWSWWQEGSIHRAPWPSGDELRAVAGETDPLTLEVAGAVLGEVRKAKSDAKVSMRAEVASVHVVDTAERIAALEAAAQDVMDAGRIGELTWSEGTPPTITVTLAESS